MNVLITGAAGFIGHKIAQRLVASNHSIVALDDLSTGLASNLCTIDGLKFVQGCVTSRAKVEEAVHNTDLIIHMASVVGQLRVAADPECAHAVSVTSTKLLLEHAKKTPFVLFSSSAVYGLTDCGVCSEEAEINDDIVLAYDGGQASYAFGKWKAEQLAMAALNERPVLIVRPFNIVGPGQPSAYGMVLPRFVDCALRNLPISIYDDGEQSRSFSHVDTFAECFVRLLGRWRSGDLCDSVFNIGTPTLTTINRLADAVEVHAECRLQRNYMPFSSHFPGKKDVRCRLPGTARLTRAIGPIRWPPIEDIVRDVYADRSRLSY